MPYGTNRRYTNPNATFQRRTAGGIRHDSLNDAVERLLRAGVGLTALAIGQVDDATDLTLSQWRALVIASDADGIRSNSRCD